MAINQRISLEGSEDIRKNLEALGKTGEQAFKQIQTASEAASASLGRFRIAAVGIVAAITAVSAAISALTRGAGETAIALSEQAAALGLTAKQWIELRRSIDAAGGSAEEFVNSTKPLLQQLGKLSAEFSGRSTQTFANGAQVTVITLGKLSENSKELLGALQKLGVRRDIIDKGSVAILNEMARIIDGMPEGTAKAAAGIQFFGAKWRDAVSALTVGFKSVGDAEAELDNKRRASRQLTEQQVADAKKAADQWEDLGKAIRAAKDQIGSVFSGSSFARAKWLTDLVDDSRMLLQTWGKLSEEGKKTFLAGLGDGAAATTFKVVLALGQQLAGVWGVLKSAGEGLMGVMDTIARVFEGITGSQVAAFFITAAIAATGLALALKAVALVLAPLSLLFSPFGAVLIAAAAAAALFWDQLSAGAAKVGALIPQELAQMKGAIAKLFTGDFAGAWNQFSTAAVSAFQKIKAAAMQTELGKTLIGGFEQFVKDLPGTIELVVKAFIGIGKAAQGVADIINTIFGTKLTGTDIVVIAILGQITGAFQALSNLANIVSNAFGGPVSSALTVAAIAAGSIVSKLGDLDKISLADVVQWFKNLGTKLDETAGKLKTNFWSSFTNDAIAAINTIIDSGINRLVAKLQEIPGILGAAAWEGFKTAGGAAIDWLIGKLDSLIAKLNEAARSNPVVGGGPGEAIPGNAAGGLIGGRGTGTSDSNLAWVSRGEHIMPARAVAQPGVLALLEALRRTGGNLRGVMGGMGRFAAGGLIPRFAEGGLVGGGMGHLGTVDLRTDHGVVRLMAGASAVEQLSRLAVTRRMTSTGKKPGFIG